MSEKPIAAFILSLLGGILVIIGGILTVIAGGLVGEILPGIGELVAALGVVGLMLGVLIIVGAVMINKGEPGSVRTGSIIVLVSSVLSLIFAGGGFFIGFLLGLIGGILGLTWKPPEKQLVSVTTLQSST